MLAGNAVEFLGLDRSRYEPQEENEEEPSPAKQPRLENEEEPPADYITVGN